jgi:hypothetical protein
VVGSDYHTITDIGPERIFGQLDNLIRVMPRATTNAIEGITMWTQNHTATWLNNLDSAHHGKPLYHIMLLQLALLEIRTHDITGGR